MPPGEQRGIRVFVSNERGVPVAAPRLARWLARVAPKGAHGHVSIALVSDRKVRALNRRYRSVDRATDVLSFTGAPSSPPRRIRRTHRKNPKQVLTFVSPASSAVEHFLGDIVIARGVARRQAREAGHSELTELRVLAVHGLLHLLGFDHERDNGRMGEMERRLLRAGGMRAGLIDRSSGGRESLRYRAGAGPREYKK
jgi:probable rRNA maturation factor